MAYEAELTTYYWDNDESEMATAAAGGLAVPRLGLFCAVGIRLKTGVD